MGVHCVEEMLKAHPERIVKICLARELSEGFQKKCPPTIPIIAMEKEQLTKLVHSSSHQSVIAYIRKRPALDCKGFLQKLKGKEESIVLMLDSIYDPQNFGALLRVAECFGVDGVVWSKNRGASITPVVTKASSGASELIDKVEVSNLAQAMKLFQDEGYVAIGADLVDAENFYEFETPGRILLIMGSEGKGLQPLLRKQCDFRVMIPMKGRIQSLNVAQAAAVFLSKWSSLKS
jgi:23S rRNA (guanosine2251-2'-O)-methyltransferase